jgi:hypothetical protein
MNYSSDDIVKRLLDKFDKHLLDTYKLTCIERTQKRDHYIREFDDGSTTIHLFVFEDGTFKLETTEILIESDGSYYEDYITEHPYEGEDMEEFLNRVITEIYFDC